MTDAFTPAWLRGEPRATHFLPLAFRDPAARRAAVADAAQRPIDPAVHAALAAQEGRRPQSAARRANLARLAEPGAVAVVTGQQVGLALGPLYTLHKAAAAVATARALEAETGHPAVPVFWLQTEDADFEEIRAVALPDQSTGGITRVTIADALGEAGARASLSERPLGPGVAAVHDELAAALHGLQHAEATLALLARHYTPEARFGDAFAGVMAELFADAGLLLLDPRAPELAACSARVHARAIAHAIPLAEALGRRAEALAAAGFRVQVPIREGAALSCFHPDGPAGPRYRLLPVGDGFELAGDPRTIPAARVAEALASEPHTFSTTALLRPLLQDVWLPTAAYVGGPGELAYFAELAPVYALFERPLPLAVPRARFLIAGPTARRLSEQLDLAPLAAGAPRDALLAELSARAGDAPVDPEQALAPTRAAAEAALTALNSALAPLDAGFEKIARRAQEGIERELQRVADRARRAVAEADAVRVARLDRLRGLTWPGGAPQERVLGFPFFAAQHGPEALVAALLAAVEPWRADLVAVDPP